MDKEYVAPELRGGVIVVDVEQGFCQSQVDKKAQIEDWEEEDFVW